MAATGSGEAGCSPAPKAGLVAVSPVSSAETQDAHAAMSDFEEQMRAVAEQIGVDITQVDGYNEAVDAIERSIDVRFSNNAKDATSDVQTYFDWLNSVPSDIYTEITTRTKGGFTPYAEGGWVDGPSGVDMVPTRLTPGRVRRER
jgi:hypothetical protein